MAAPVETGLEVEAAVAAYEERRARTGRAEVADFLPPPAHPAYLHVLHELVRVDMEFRFQDGTGRRVEEYLERFPRLREDPDGLGEIAFEEYRLRRRAGEDPSPEEYQRRLGVRTANWPTAAGELVGSAPEPFPGWVDLELAATAYLERCPELSAGRAIRDVLCTSTPVPECGRLFWELHQAAPEDARRLARAVTELPLEGTSFLDFHLVRELGRGALGRVFLARQGELADRPVALKVSGDVRGESRVLAQLQHTHIVPVYSAHRAGPFQALCMPFFGGTTLHHVVRALHRLPEPPATGAWLVGLLEERRQELGDAVPEAQRPPVGEALEKLKRLPYADAVLELAGGLADGLAHAHERGIRHGDLKPANVLLSDDGRLMLLDFNLADDGRLGARDVVAYVGGTLPYMAPEQLVAPAAQPARGEFRADIYAVGLILYELFTGRYPFPLPGGRLPELVDRLARERVGPPPSVRRWNRRVSPAAEAIVRRCLEPEPARRYPTAHQLAEDLRRQRAHLPLLHTPEPSWGERARKWGRRHPRLASAYSLGALAVTVVAILAGLYVARVRELGRSEAARVRAEAADVRYRFGEDLQASRFLLNNPVPDAEEVRVGLEVAAQAGGLYPADADSLRACSRFTQLPGSDQKDLVHDLVELSFLRARGLRLQAQRASPKERSERLRDALALNQEALALTGEGSDLRPLRLQQSLLLGELGREDEARRLRAEAERMPLRTARDHYLLAGEEVAQGRFERAVTLLRRAQRLAPENPFVFYALGVCHASLGRPDRAVSCFDTCIALWPRFFGGYYQRARASQELKDQAQALADFDEALRLRPDFLPAYVDRALTLNALNRPADAAADVTRAIDAGLPQTRLYFMRAAFRQRAGDGAGARRDREEGLRRQPADELSWVVRGLNRLPNDPKSALSDLDEALKLDPRSRTALEDKAHVLAERLGRTEEAVAVLDQAVALYPDYVQARAGRGVLLARLNRREAAHRDAEEALRLDPQPAVRYQVAGVYALTSRQNPDDRSEAFRLLTAALRAGYGADLLATDPDLEPIRALPEFQRLTATSKLPRR